MNILLLDNHDSFTWNLVELLRAAGKGSTIILRPEELRPGWAGSFDRVIFSPGPGLPQEQPVMFRVLEQVGKLFLSGEKTVPVLGVCLGMQAVALHYGGSLFNLSFVVHGQSRELLIRKKDHPLFRGIPDRTPVGLYHSWAVDPDSLPGTLEVLAHSPEGTVMALAHRSLPVCGVQFHPESFMTRDGLAMVRNWLDSVHPG